MLRSASTRPRLSLPLRMPCLGARAMLNPSSTPRKIAMRSYSHPSASKSQAGTRSRPTLPRPYYRLSPGKSISLQNGDAPQTAGLLQHRSRVPNSEFGFEGREHVVFFVS